MGLNNWANRNYIDKSGASTGLRNQAALHEQQAAAEQKNEQAYMQNANRNYRDEADNNGRAQSAAENTQIVDNTENAAAGASALARVYEKGDYDKQQDVTLQQRDKGIDAQREKYGAQQTAEEERTNANVTDYQAKEVEQRNDEAERLSKGETVSGGTNTNPQQPANTNPQQPANTNPQPADTNPQPADTNPQPEQPEQPSNDEPQMPEGDHQHVINWLLGSSKGDDLRSNPEGGGPPNSGAPDAELAQYIQQKYGLQPVARWKYDAQDPSAKSWEALYIKENGQKAQDAFNELRTGRAAKFGGTAKSNYTVDSSGQYHEVQSDARQKNIIAALSSIRY